MSELAKLDTGLFLALHAFEMSSDDRHPDSGISVSLTFQGDLSAIEALGFQTNMVEEGVARGVVRFRDIPGLTAHPGVVRMTAGSASTYDLETAAKDIKARASSPLSHGDTPIDGLWHADEENGTLTQIGDATGAGVIVAIIDSGIDYTHPMFMSQLKPARKSRIIRIWDQGLVPFVSKNQTGPDPALLLSLDTYGTEFVNGVVIKSDGTQETKLQIDEALNGPDPLRHVDCVGHGTHVAGIAAGGPVFPNRGDATNVGVAPEADIIAVKYLDVEKAFFSSTNNEVGDDDRFKDAILYCLRTAKLLGKPVVINVSLGNSLYPGDGLDELSAWLDKRLDPSGQPPSPPPTDPPNYYFPTGAVIVKSCGNDGDIEEERRTAIITIPTAGHVILPLELVDTRRGQSLEWGTSGSSVVNICGLKPHQPKISVNFWYRRLPPPDTVTFEVHVPHFKDVNGADAFFPAVAAADSPQLKYLQSRIGPPRETVAITPKDKEIYFLLKPDQVDPRPHPDASPSSPDVERDNFFFGVSPKVHSEKSIKYLEGVYKLRITAPQNTKIFMLCGRQRWASGKYAMFQVHKPKVNEDPSDPSINVTNRSSSVAAYGRHVVTVAAYDDTQGNPGKSEHHAIAPFSSRGPMRDFSDPPLGPIAVKPDIAAPGVKIKSAASANAFRPPALRKPSWRDGVRFKEMKGTSMATPMVAGAVALLLDKEPNLNTDDVRERFKGKARPGVKPDKTNNSQAHDQAYGSGMVDVKESYENKT